jgi:Na+-transporting methylmalonyl-CoA/oxaloacetate decarboxylase gamma subunit
MARELQIAGISISLTTLGFLALAVWLKAFSILIDDWFVKNNTIIFIVSTFLIIFCVTVGAVTFKSWFRRVAP